MNKEKDLTVDEIFAAIPENMQQNLDWAAKLGAYARFYNLKHLAYEGGQHLQDHINAGNADAKVAANRDPRMGEMVEKYLRGWQAIDGDLFMYFTLSSGYSKWGSWDLVEDISKSSPKYEAALSVLNGPPTPITLGAAPGETIGAGAFLGTNSWDKKGASQVQIEPGKWLQYVVRVPNAGNYQLATLTSSDENAKAEIWVNSKLGATLEVAPGKATTVSIPLEAGVNAVRIKGQSGRFQLKSLSIAK